jgi:ABC-type polysaccharide/polyol phosphate export permease
VRKVYRAVTNQPDTALLRVMSARRDSARQYANPLRMLRHLWAQRELIVQFTRREVVGRYKGSCLGLAWSFVTPLVMLAVYTLSVTCLYQNTGTTLFPGGVSAQPKIFMMWNVMA